MANFDDQRMESIMGLLLRFGVVLASTVVLAGGAFYIEDHRGQRVNYRTFTAHPISLLHPGAWADGIAHGDAASIIYVGILLLILTPIVRVAFALVGFAIERDRLYMAVSALILAILLWGLIRGT